MKCEMYDKGHAVAAEAAYRGSAVARIGHHNDCFLADESDLGTYSGNKTNEYTYLAKDTRYVAMGGETCCKDEGPCPYPDRSECPTAVAEMRMFHWSYLNRDRETLVLDSWTTQACMDQVQQRLGYRFTLLSSSFTSSVTQNTAMRVRMSIKNEGWAAPYNPRPVRLMLRDTATGEVVHSFTLPYDARHWQADTTIMIDNLVTIPDSVPAGTYALLLSLPDPLSSLGDRPQYAIQLANTGLWEEEPATGLNDLKRSVSVRL